MLLSFGNFSLYGCVTWRERVSYLITNQFSRYILSDVDCKMSSYQDRLNVPAESRLQIPLFSGISINLSSEFLQKPTPLLDLTKDLSR